MFSTERLKPALQCVRIPEPTLEEKFSEAVRKGLSMSPKQIPSRFFYDERGSALFERITELPEYYLTSCEQEILCDFAPEIVETLASPLRIIELGSGSAKKTTLLIEAALARQSSLEYMPIDISEEFMLGAARKLLAAYPGLRVTAVAGEYFSALKHLSEQHLLETRSEVNVFLFLGSNIGNFEAEDSDRLLAMLRSSMRETDFLLIGLDLAKDPSVIEPAYNDAAGVTEAFNKNLLLRINRELGGNFDLLSFQHEAPYLVDERRVEMRLVSTREQEVAIAGRPYSFLRGEYIHTENSRKYSQEDIEEMLARAGLTAVRAFFDSRRWFTLVLAKPLANSA